MTEILNTFLTAHPVDSVLTLIFIAGAWEGLKILIVDIARSRNWI